MAEKDNTSSTSADAARLKEEKRKLAEEQKRAKDEQKRQKKEAKQKARELAEEEAKLSDDEGSNFPVIVTTLIIVLVWLAILGALIKLDVGGFGSGVLAPVLKNVPVINKILPDTENVATEEGEYADVDTSGYASLKEAVKQIQDLEIQLQDVQTSSAEKDEQIVALQEEVNRLQTFEDKQVEFERIKTEFYNEVVYADKGPGAEAYQKYYETMDPATAEVLYKQVVTQIEEDKEITDYAQAYSEMKPKEAAKIFENMTDNLELAARILDVMEPDDRGKILGAMDPTVAAKITKIMEPDS